jgi:hypothetical protein
MKKRDPKKDTGYEVKLDRYKKQIESTSHLYEIKLKHGKRMGSQTL